MGKRLQASETLAEVLLDMQVGETLPTTGELAARAGVGYGTVHTALRAFAAEGLVEVTTHGRNGSKLANRDLVGLWRASGRGSFVGVLPLPYSREFAGLATALTMVAERAALPLQLTFRQGVETRLRLLREARVDWVLASGAVAEDVTDCEAMLLPPFTYYDRDSVVILTAAGRTPDAHGRVPIDHRSRDHVALTMAEFPDANHVDAPYLWIPELVLSGEVDAAVWHKNATSALLTATGLEVHPLQHPSPGDDGALTQAALLMREGDAAVRGALRELFDIDELTAIQRRVVDRQILPAF